MSEHENEQPDEFEGDDGAEVDNEPDADDPDEHAEQPDDAEPAAEAAPVQDEDRAKLAKGLSTRYETYKASMIRLLDDEASEWIVCPLCTSSMAPGFVNVNDFGRVPDEIRANVDTYFGLAREQDYAQDPNTRTCPTCNGRTKVKSGASDGDYIVRGCPECKGYGFIPPPGAPSSAATGNGSQEAAVAGALADLDTPERDNWGEPRVLPDGTVNGNYGKMPQFKQVHPVFGVTANLSAEDLVTG